MRQTFYLLRNNSNSDGNYLIDGVYKPIYPDEKIQLNRRPTSVTSNVTVSIFRKEVGETILHLKPKTVKAEKNHQ